MKINNKYDLVVAWWWPGWVTSAITFKKLNPESKILIFDINSFPKHKIWEVILPGSFIILRKLWLLKAIKEYWFLRKMWVYYYWWKSKDKWFLLPSSRLEEKKWIFYDMTPENYSYHVERYQYDNILIKEAIKLWIDFKQNVKIWEINYLDDNNINYLVVNNVKIKADFYIDSTWINKWIITSKIKKFKEKDFSWDICYHWYLEWANFLHNFNWLKKRVATTVWSYWNKCWFWYIPITENIVSVWVVFKSSCNKDFVEIKDKEELLINVLCSFTKIKNAIKDAKFINYKWLEKITIIKNWNWISNKLCWDNWMLVWDSAFFSDPILSAWVTMAHKTWFFAWTLLNSYLKSDSSSYKKLLLKTYDLYCKDFYSQVSDVIKFWYDWMDEQKDINSLFDIWKDTMKKFGIVDNVSSRSTFMYVVNWLFQSIDTWWDYTTLYEQDDYENIIEWLTWINISLNVNNIDWNDVYEFVNDFNITKRLKLDWFDFKLTKFLQIKNIYNSSFFINDFISDFVDNINWNNTLNDIITILKWKYHDIILEDLYKIIKKFILLNLIKCM